MSSHALLRGVPESFAGALTSGDREPALDAARARRQHDGYRRALEGAGFDVSVLAGDEAHPDCPFIEDTAVLLGPVALLARPGAPTRRGEVGPVAAVLREHFDVTEATEPATVDGGDVLEVGGTVYVGRSSRTNDAGIETVVDIASTVGLPVVAVDVSGVLHLQSAVTALDGETVLGRSDAVDPNAFAGVRWVEVPAGERSAANVVMLGGRSVLIAAGFPATAEALQAAGYEPVDVEVDEFAKADGGLTCLSLRW